MATVEYVPVQPDRIYEYVSELEDGIAAIYDILDELDRVRTEMRETMG